MTYGLQENNNLNDHICLIRNHGEQKKVEQPCIKCKYCLAMKVK